MLVGLTVIGEAMERMSVVTIELNLMHINGIITLLIMIGRILITIILGTEITVMTLNRLITITFQVTPEIITMIIIMTTMTIMIMIPIGIGLGIGNGFKLESFL